MSGFQLSGDAPTIYNRVALKLMEPWTEDLIVSGRVRDGDRVLDLACGTGVIAGRVKTVTGKLCTVVGLDINEAMINAARKIPDVEWHQGSALEMPFPDGNFDVVLCQQGLQFFPDRSAAMREIARVLAPGGRVAASVWGPLNHQPVHIALLGSIEKFLGAELRAPLDAAFVLAPIDALRSLGEGAGFKNVHVRLEHRTGRYPSPANLARGWVAATPAASAFAALSEERKEAFVRNFVDHLAGYIDDDGLAVTMQVHFLTARK
jgi:SAM-dependent methyltransferase